MIAQMQEVDATREPIEYITKENEAQETPQEEAII